MITISRRLAKTVASMVRRTLRLAGRAAAEQIVQVFTDREGLRIIAVGEHHAIEYGQALVGLKTALVVVPLKALTTVAADSDEDCTLGEDWRGATSFSWRAGKVPQAKTFDPVDPAKIKTLPIDSIDWTSQPPDFLIALREAFRTTDDASSRFAMTCVQIRGENGAIAATDGRALYSHIGFSFPFRDSLLLRPTHVFERDDLFDRGPVSIGLAGDHLAIRTGPWNLYLGINRDGRFPNVDAVVPHVDGDTPRIELGAGDGAFLGENLKRLPARDDVNQPVTVDIDGKVTIRAREPDSTAMDYVLTGSQHQGEKCCAAIDRRYLERAAQLGFTTISFTGAESPVVCRDGYRTFVWATLDKSQISPLSPDAVVIESANSPRGRRRPKGAAA